MKEKEEEIKINDWNFKLSDKNLIKQFNNLLNNNNNNNNNLNLKELKSLALKGKINKLISFHWKLFFSILPIEIIQYETILNTSRSEYIELRNKYLKSPDGRWLNGLNTNKVNIKSDNLLNNNDEILNDPLSLDMKSPWINWFESLDLIEIIKQDVDRTFQEIEYFRLPSTKDMMSDILLIYAKLEPTIGYKQGMNEILALVLIQVYLDSISSSSTSSSSTDSESLARLVLSSTFIEHDAWSLFFTIMKSLKQYYDTTPSISIPRSSFDKPSHSSYDSITIAPPSSSTIAVQPLLATSIRIQDQLLKNVDFPLYEKLAITSQIEPQLYTTKWLRLLFSREFSSNFQSIYQLWSGLFAQDPTLKLVEEISIIMLERIREPLLFTQDYSEFLTLLLRYPTPSNSQDHISILLQQAIYLRDNSSSAAVGEKIRNQNIEMGILYGEGSSLNSSKTTLNHIGSASDHSSGLVGDIAKGVYERAEALGINKALFSTFNEIRKGVVAQNTQFNKDFNNNFPSSLSIPPSSQSKEYLAIINKLKQERLSIGKAMEICIETLEKPLTSTATNVGTEESLLVLTALHHIKDVLLNAGVEFDQGVMDPLLALQQHQKEEENLNSTTTRKISTPISLEQNSLQLPPSTSNTNSKLKPNIKEDNLLLLGNRNYKPSASLSRTPLIASTSVPKIKSTPIASSPPSNSLPSSPLLPDVNISLEGNSSASRNDNLDPLSDREVLRSRSQFKGKTLKGKEVEIDPLGVLG